ncbi:MAG TPA: ATP-binding protein [Chloroflexia bacterium]|nr:ATP-binding protein [Chloroflexia bacterium]
MQTDRSSLPELENVLAGGGEMGKLMRSLDWSKTKAGAVTDWPQSLRTAVSILLASRFPMIIFWGPELVQFYNDAYRPMLGATKHPAALGQRASECWPEIWDVIGPMLHGVLDTGQATWSDNQLLLMDRYDYVEETYFTFSYSPIRDESGGIGGVFCAVTETTGQVLGERRLRTLRELASSSLAATSAEGACQMTLATLAENKADLPFSILYLLDNNGQYARLIGNTGLSSALSDEASSIELSYLSPRVSESQVSGKALNLRELVVEACKTGQTPWTLNLVNQLPELRTCLEPGISEEALVLQISHPTQAYPAGLLIAGINRRRALDEEYQGFFNLIASNIRTAIANARAYEEERRRAEALAELDRAKTAFFSNVSHEFRTPLTLMLGPAEDALADAQTPLPTRQRERMEIIRRNGLRLTRLVNALLDFSRIEAGRIRALYEPTDLATYTSELASAFRSAVEKAGLRLRVDCPVLLEPVYIDREMWEKIVLNLLSNAFKFTFEGEISVRLSEEKGQARLEISDTGCGIPPNELLHIFERFHQVEGTRSRTHEGSGIGLALVQELIHLHGGRIEVSSKEGEGTLFTVTLPLGKAHLNPSHIKESSSESGEIASNLADSSSARIASYLEEAQRLLAGLPENELEIAETLADTPEGEAITAPVNSSATGSHILLVDDNADMREYLKRLLKEQGWQVTTTVNGKAALDTLRKNPPDLVLTDVMMPELDGIGLLQAIRAHEETRLLPVVLLSARAGEEAEVKGLETGADDYLIKPFSARELIARVRANLELGQARQAAIKREREYSSQLQSLARASLAISSKLELNDLLQLIIEQAREIIGAHQAIISFTVSDDWQQSINAVSFSDRYARWRGYHATPDGSGIYSLVCRHNRPMRLTQSELEAHPNWQSFGCYAQEHPPLRGWLAVPLVNREGGNLGLIQLSDKYDNKEFSEGDEAILAQFAQVASVAIENARLYETVQQALQERERFLSIAAHELKTPVTSLRGFAQLLLRQLNKQQALDPERTRRALDSIDKQSEKLTRLVSRLLDLSRLETGRLVLETEKVDLTELVEGVVTNIQASAAEHSLYLKSPAKVIARIDPLRFEQVVTNLIDNAIKYSPQGGNVWITLSLPEPDTLRMSVEDQGPGIDPAYRELIFKPFYQAKEGFRAGLGLGLYVSQQIIELHHGKIETEFPAEGGSRFIVTLPGVVIGA